MVNAISIYLVRANQARNDVLCGAKLAIAQRLSIMASFSLEVLSESVPSVHTD